MVDTVWHVEEEGTNLKTGSWRAGVTLQSLCPTARTLATSDIYGLVGPEEEHPLTMVCLTDKVKPIPPT
jgi:hypothetical protein